MSRDPQADELLRLAYHLCTEPFMIDYHRTDLAVRIRAYLDEPQVESEWVWRVRLLDRDYLTSYEGYESMLAQRELSPEDWMFQRIERAQVGPWEVVE